MNETVLNDLTELLRPISPVLPRDFSASLAPLTDSVSSELLHLWIEAGLDLGDWESAGEYFNSGLKLLPSLDEEKLRAWVEGGSTLARLAPPVATAYFRAGAEVLPLLTPDEIGRWVEIGARLYRPAPKVIDLTASFFAEGRALIKNFSLDQLSRLVDVFLKLLDKSPDHAANALNGVAASAGLLEAQDRDAYLDLAFVFFDEAWPDTAAYLERAPRVLEDVEPFARTPMLQLSAHGAPKLGRQTLRLLSEAASALKSIQSSYHGRLVELAEMLVRFSPVASMFFLKNAPVLMQRLDMDGVEAWHQVGVDTFVAGGGGGEHYFKLESVKAERTIDSLTNRVDLAHVAEVLNLYGKALTGANIAVRPIGALAERGIGWVADGGASTEGRNVYLPEHMEDFETKEDNFAAYKVYATHQAARLEFGSFRFRFDRDGSVFPRHRGELEVERRDAFSKTEGWTSDMERFYDLFPDRRLASDIFSVCEDTRIDARIRQEYSGIRRMNRRIQEIELTRRPNTYFLPLRVAFVENLVRTSLDGKTSTGWPREYAAVLLDGIKVLERLRDPAATVEDSAEATLLLYELAEKVPNIEAGDDYRIDWMSATEMEEEDPLALRRSSLEEQGVRAVYELEYMSPDDVGAFGDFKPELVQLLMRLREEADALGGEGSPLTAEQLRELLMKSVEIELPEDMDLSDIDALLKNLQDAANPPDEPEDESEMQMPERKRGPEVGVRLYHYDEWDYLSADYRPRWCTVHERRLEEGDDAFFEKTLETHAALVQETQRNFELIRPDTFTKIKRLEDGEDVDLDAAIDYVAQRRSGHGENPKVYWRRNKTEREVAVAFLMDMSSSTETPIDKTVRPWKRVMDIEKESLVLSCSALEVIGDKYGIYGFSGSGRENVQFYVIKDMNEAFGDTVKRRIDKMAPLESTRMGPAIRHTARKLLSVEARARILFLVSDGRPLDKGYGPTPGDHEYAIHDTHRALMEAKSKGITPFILTVDKDGNDYLAKMCGDMAYEVLDDISLMPSRLPRLYRMLTE